MTIVEFIIGFLLASFIYDSLILLVKYLYIIWQQKKLRQLLESASRNIKNSDATPQNYINVLGNYFGSEDGTGTKQ